MTISAPKAAASARAARRRDKIALDIADNGGKLGEGDDEAIGGGGHGASV